MQKRSTTYSVYEQRACGLTLAVTRTRMDGSLASTEHARDAYDGSRWVHVCSACILRRPRQRVSAAAALLWHAMARPIGEIGPSDAIGAGGAGSARLVDLRASPHGSVRWHAVSEGTCGGGACASDRLVVRAGAVPAHKVRCIGGQEVTRRTLTSYRLMPTDRRFCSAH